MKRSLIVLCSAIFMVAILTFPVSAESIIGIVDFEILQEESSEFMKVREQLQKKADELKAKLGKESNELAKLEEEYQKQSMMLSLDAQETKRKELDRKKRYYNYIFEEYNRELKEAEIEATRMMSKQVRSVLGDIGKAGGFTLILDKATPGLLYERGAVDITAEVIKALDRRK
jgi:outer membrane protein